MAQFWDYIVDSRIFEGLTPERLAEVRAQNPGGRAVTSVAHIARVPGDDATDHIMRHKYGVDPDTYRGTLVPRGAPAQSRTRQAKRPAKNRPAKAWKPSFGRDSGPSFAQLNRKIVHSRLVKLALKESPSLATGLQRLVNQHLRGARAQSRHSFIGLPLIIRSTARSVRVAFASEQ
ncbi:MAG TPA: hypothetical protein VGK73_04085 [Polyangiaceae bacterium]